jgi:hypothetical protein
VTVISVDEVRSEAATVPKAADVAATAVAAVFFAIGWVLGGLWKAIVFCWAAAVIGFHRARARPEPDPAPAPATEQQPPWPARRPE